MTDERAPSLQRQLRLVILVTCGVALLLACGAIAFFEVFDFRHSMARDTTTLAAIVGKNTRGALAFSDDRAATEILQALQSDPHVMMARLYSRDGAPFADYLRPGISDTLPAALPGPGPSHRFSGDQLEVLYPVDLDDSLVGTLLLRVDLEGLYDRLRLFAGIVVLVLGASLLVAIGVGSRLQRPITAPLLALADTARAVAERKDYSVRVPASGAAETRRLTGSFNHMIATVENRDRALHLANEALRESQHLLQAIADHATAVIYVKDSAGRYLFINRRYEELFHLRLVNVAGKTDYDLFPREHADAFRVVDQRVVTSGEPISIEEIAPHDDGPHTYLSIKCPLRHQDGTVFGLCGISTDITDRKRSEEAVRESEERFRVMADSAPVLIWVADTDQRCTWFNRAWLEFVGRPMEEELGHGWADNVHPDDVARCLEIYTTHFETRTAFQMEYRLRRHDGAWRWILDKGVPRHGPDRTFSGFIGSCLDITEHKLAERKLQDQLARLALLHRITRAIGERQDLPSIFQVVIHHLEEQLPLDLCCFLLHDGDTQELTVARIGGHSATLAQQLGLLEHTRVPVDRNGLHRCVLGHLVYEPELAPLAFPFPQRLLRGGLGSVVFAPLLVESHVFGVLVAARRQAHGFSSAECEFLRQVSEHIALAAHQAQLHQALQRAYDDLRQTQQAVLQQERLRALGQMASGIAHDINNAISPVALYTESLLEQEPGLSPRTRDYLGIIQHAISDVAHTVARMREFYRQREAQLDLAPVQLGPVIDQVADLTRARWGDMPQQRGVVITFVREVEPGLPAILGVESEIREALTNLIFNAVDAMPEGGMLTLRARRSVENRPADGPEPRQRVCLEVSDTGIGMDDDTRRRCLEPFFTTKGERGTGLGLAMVYGIVQRHGADLDIDSAPGRGTTVRLTFALPAGTGTAAAPAAPSVRPGRLRLLIIDDDPLIIKSLRDTLEADGHLVVPCNDGQSGVERFRTSLQSGESFAAIITDLGMPHLDGRKVAAAMKALSPTTPVILLTGWGQRLAAEGDLPAHVDCVLGKPPRLRELREVLARLCAHSSNGTSSTSASSP